MTNLFQNWLSDKTTKIRQSSVRASQQGLTLVEIIVVLVILSLLIGFLTGGIFGQGEKAKAKMNEIRMKKLEGHIDEFRLMYNQVPNSLEALVRCNEQTGAGCIPIADEDELKDAWGTPYQYQSSGQSYSLRSLGSDQREGGEGVAGDRTITGP